MVPSGLAAVLSFLLLLAPGIVWELQRSRYHTSVKETTLIEASRIVLASLVATVVAGLLLSWVWLPLYHAARTEAFDTPVTLVPYVGAAIANSGVACALSLGLSWARWPDRPKISGKRVWERAFVGLRPFPDMAPYLTVFLENGAAWQGQFVAFDSDPDDGHRNVALGPPVRRQLADESAFKFLPEVNLVALPEASITSIEVSYVSPD